MQAKSGKKKEGIIMEKKKCPRCGESYTGFPALSRVDNKTDICSPCGTQEGLDDFYRIPLRALDK
jgi:ribosomal protein S27AE